MKRKRFLFFYGDGESKKEVSHSFEYIFINDGSKDETLKVLRDLAKRNDFVRYISFSRNFGKEVHYMQVYKLLRVT